MSDALIEGHLPNLINGVSQQAPSLRRVDQCEDQENCRNSLVEGMGKRFNTVLKGEISGTDPLDEYHINQVERDDYERYKIMVSDTGVRVIDADTAIDYPVVVEDAEALTYLTREGNIPTERAYQVLTTIDHSLILNKTVPVRHLPFAEENLAPDVSEQRTAIISLTKSPYKASQRGWTCVTS
jgi:hypothetical protein